METAEGFTYFYFGGMLGVYWVDYPQDHDNRFMRKWYLGARNLNTVLRNLQRVYPEVVLVDRRLFR
jgi:hypothetical protein